jgi:hypothetical protein
LQIQNYGGRRVPGGKPVAPKFDGQSLHHIGMSWTLSADRGGFYG